jgi:hypothetical protein
MRNLIRMACTASLLVACAWARPVHATAAETPALPPPRVRAWQTGLLRTDRLEHATLAFTVGLGAGVLSRSPAAAAGSAFAVGLAKEIRDRRHGGFDPLDLAADTFGAACAAFATAGLKR